MNEHRKDIRGLTVTFGDGSTKQIHLEKGWMSVADNHIKTDGGGIAESFVSLTLGGRVAQRHDDAPDKSQIPKSIPENDEEANGITS